MKKIPITQEELKKRLHYNHKTGVWTRLVSIGGPHLKGSKVGSLHIKGYRCIMLDGIQYKSGRLAWFYMTGEWPIELIDHINRIRDDDRWENLRSVTKEMNQQNRESNFNNTTGITGVSFRKKCKAFRVRIDGNHIGQYKTLLEAAKSRWHAEITMGWLNTETTSTAYNYIQLHDPKFFNHAYTNE